MKFWFFGKNILILFYSNTFDSHELFLTCLCWYALMKMGFFLFKHLARRREARDSLRSGMFLLLFIGLRNLCLLGLVTYVCFNLWAHLPCALWWGKCRVRIENRVLLRMRAYWTKGQPWVSLSQHSPVQHEGWMISGQETVFCWVLVL